MRILVNAVSLLLATFFSAFSTSVMSYITLATPIGPWMGPTLALMGTVLVKCFSRYLTTETMLLAVISGSLGGILATAISFSFPTFYFLNPSLFNQWTSNPFQFIGALFALAVTGGGLGLWVAYMCKDALLKNKELPFPVGKLVYEIATASNQKNKSQQLAGGFFGTFIYCFMQATTWFRTTIVASPLTLLSKFRLGCFMIPAIQFDLSLMPMLWSIGFIAGHLITIPLLVGALTRVFFADLVQCWFFPYLTSSEFMLAFCSGMVLSGAVTSLFTTPAKMWKFFSKSGVKTKTFDIDVIMKIVLQPSVLIMLTLCFGVLSFFNFSLLAQIYLVAFAGVCTYQIVVIAGKIGMALLGRFATFVMLPGLFLFGFNAVQVTIVATFVELCGGIATEILFGLKTAQLANINKRDTFYFQVFGLILSSFVVSVVFWLLVTHFQLGSGQLFAQRSQARALLVQAGNFDYTVVAIGVAFGFVLKQFKMNPMLVLGGLLMSLSLTLGLVTGGLSTFLYKDKQKLEPLCSGMYAANSLWMIIHALW
jgi:uncharacterized oligopeptide transporter (OPT) family protein